MSSSSIQSLIDEKSAKREKLIAAVKSLDIEINALYEAISIMDGSNKADFTRSKKRNRALQEKWATVLKFIGQNGDVGFDVLYPKADELEIPRNSMRGQMANYVNEGWLERVAEGVFRLTNSGAVKCGYSEKESPAEAGDIGEGSTNAL